MTLLKVANLSLLRSSKDTSMRLDGVEFSVGRGEIIGIVGPNGAGKSTLMQCICHLIDDYSGHVYLNDKDVAKMSGSVRASQLSYLPQHCSVNFPYRVNDVLNMAFYSAPSVPVAIRQQQIKEVLAQLDIESLYSRNISELSGGEQQLVHLARTVLQGSSLMLLDEPNASLDLSHESRLWTFLKQLRDDRFSTILAIHDLNTAARICDKIALLSNGKLVGFGPVNQVLTADNLHQIYTDRVEVFEGHLGQLTIQSRID